MTLSTSTNGRNRAAAPPTSTPPVLRDRVRAQFDDVPYPNLGRNVDDEMSGRGYNSFCDYAFYVRDGRLPRRDLRILDVGCGSGPRALGLAAANPESTVVGVDFSERSVEAARARAEEVGVANAEFRVLSIEELDELEGEFDFVNCEDVLYLLDDPLDGLKRMGAKLSPKGILRANLHNEDQRRDYLRCQAVLKELGISDKPTKQAVAETREFFAGLTRGARLRRRTWRKENPTEGHLLSNHLLINDKGFTLRETFDLIEAAGLEFFEMVDAPQWLPDAFVRNDTEEGCLVAGRLAQMERKRQLLVIEGIHYRSRLFDFWCGHPGPERDAADPLEWSDSRWGVVQIRLHPALCQEEMIAEVRRAIDACEGWNLTRWAPYAGSAYWLAGHFLELLSAIGLEGRSYADLESLWNRAHPIELSTGRERDPLVSQGQLRRTLRLLERLGALMLIR